MKKTSLYFIVFALALTSCDNYDHKVSYSDFIEHLNKNDKFLNDSILYRWRVWTRYDESNSDYLLWYDTGTNPFYDKYGEFCDVNTYNFKTGKFSFPWHQVDTIFFCKLWGIEKDSFSVHIKTVCKHLRDIMDGYRINEMAFYRNGFCIFLSAYNDWGVVYQKDSTQSLITQKYELMLLKNGYSRIDGTRFWVHKPGTKEE